MEPTRLRLDELDNYDDLDDKNVVRVQTCEILSSEEKGTTAPRMQLRIDLPDGETVVILDQPVSQFVMAARGVAAKYGV